MSVGVSCVVAVLAAGQAQPQTPAPAVSLERVQRELQKEPPPARLTSSATFRVEIEASPLKLRSLWDRSADTAVADYVRTRLPLYHHEFLSMVTPEAFRAGTLYPIGASSSSRGAQALGDAIRSEWRRAREAAARRQVEEELRRFLDALERGKVP